MQPLEGKLVLPSLLEEVSRAGEAVLAAVAKCGYGEQDRFAIQLALEEALANAVRHGNAADPGKHVTVEFRVDADCVCVSVEDEGHGFRPDSVPDPTLDENLEKPDGRGVMLMRVYMNEVRYNPAGNKVTMTKRRTRTGPAERNK
jgi:serine/threonine-protein kinase RsbW